jgi:hypothetical protein
MDLIEIDAVEMLDGVFDHLTGASVEAPVAGAASGEWWLRVSGWVLGRHEPVTAVDVVQQDVRVASAGVEIVRGDVAAAHPGAPGAEHAGFSLRMGGVWLPRTFTLRLEAAFENGHRVPFAVIHGRREALAISTEEPLQSISVTALPRSGATLVMQMLAAHPQVAVASSYPYSGRPAAYWEHMVRVLSAPADRRESSDPDRFDADLHWIGSHPLNGPPLTDSAELSAWFGREYVQELAEFARSSTSALYARVAAAQGLRAPRYYAEKREPGPTARMTASLHPRGREILVVRDFRDMACSMLAFAHTQAGERRGDAEFMLSLVPALARLVAYRHERGDAALVVRYEDLITEPAATLETILDHLELECERRRLKTIIQELEAETPEIVAHRTSADTASSLARHANDLDADALAAAEASFAPALHTFGYARAGVAASG